jgi:hypothetical protein
MALERRPRGGSICSRCGAETPCSYLRLEQNIGMVFTRVRRSLEGWFCPSCARSAFFKMTLPMLFFGWFGFISFFVTPVFLITNVFNYAGAARRGGLVVGGAFLVALSMGTGVYFLVTRLPRMMPGYYDPNAHKLPNSPAPTPPPPPPKSPEQIRRERLTAAEESLARLEKTPDRDAAVLLRRLYDIAKGDPACTIAVTFKRRSELVSARDPKVVELGESLGDKALEPVEAKAVRSLEGVLSNAFGSTLVRCEPGPGTPGNPAMEIDYALLPAPDLVDDPAFRSRSGTITEILRLQPLSLVATLRLRIAGDPSTLASVTGEGRPRVVPARPGRPIGGFRPIGYEYTDRTDWALEDFFGALDRRFRIGR